MTEQIYKKIKAVINIASDLFILTICLFETGFWEKLLGEQFAWSVPSDISRFEPVSGNLDELLFLNGEELKTVLITLVAGLITFFIIKILLSLVFEKIKLMVSRRKVRRIRNQEAINRNGRVEDFLSSIISRHAK